MILEALRLLNHGALLAALGLLCLLGASFPWVVVQHLRLRRKGLAREAALLALPLPTDDRLPHVLVQLPTYNEGPVIRRAAEACGNLDWPRDKLHIQILDDSTDASAEIAQEVAALLRSRGIDAAVHHRTARSGFKGAALQAGLRHSNHEYVAIFDADFVPPRAFLRRCLRVLLADRGLAFVQARSDGLNAGEGLLTRAQQCAIDGFCAVHQTARGWSGHFVHFMGSCAVWRRAAVDDVGGWAADIQPEDLDISLRTLLRGWRALALATVSVPGELPRTRADWRRQQYRWTGGLTQAMHEYSLAIWRSGLTLPGKLVAMSWLSSCIYGPVVGVVAIAGLVDFLLGAGAGGAVCALIAVAALETAFIVAAMALGGSLVRGTRPWRQLPRALGSVLVLVYSQLSVVGSVLDVLRGKAPAWTPTPKGGSDLAVGRGRGWPVPSDQNPGD